MKFCCKCANPVIFTDVEGDHRSRYVCTSCGKIHYQNPRIITGCLPIWKDKVLLCKRAIEPRLGLWNVPGGFLENDETVEAGAAREVLEEANIAVEIIGIHSIYSLPHFGQVYLHFLAQLTDLSFSCGVESLEVRLFSEEEIPWEEMAFTSSTFCLKKYFEDRKNGVRKVHLGELKGGLKFNKMNPKN